MEKKKKKKCLSFPFIFFFFLHHHEVCTILFLQPGIKPLSPAGEAWSPNHWTTREFPEMPFN